MSTYYSDDAITLYHGAAVEELATMTDGSVDCIVTSPPYFGLRDYGVDGQIGAEPTPAEFVAALTAVFREARRVLADDGTLWVNLGDSYSGPTGPPSDQKIHARTGDGTDNKALAMGDRGRRRKSAMPAKNLLGIPWRVAFALQDDGWILRNEIIWAKPNAMPESVTDRMSNRHEHVFMFSKRTKYWFDLDAVREPHAASTVSAAARKRIPYAAPGQRPNLKTRGMHARGKNPGDVWNITTKPFRDAHFAVFPPEIPDRCIRAGCKPGGTVLDPFSGSGTTGMAALALGRRYIGIDLNAEYLDLSLRTRLQQDALNIEATP